MMPSYERVWFENAVAAQDDEPGERANHDAGQKRKHRRHDHQALQAFRARATPRRRS